MNTKEYEVEELNNSELQQTDGGLLVFPIIAVIAIAGIIIAASN